MTQYLEAQKQDRKRRRRERYLIVCVLILVTLLTYAGTQIFDLGLDLPFSASILVFSLINLNVILLLLLLYLTLRNLVKLLFERKKNVLGARLRTKLVFAFILLSLLPTIILFLVSAQFISSALEYWFSMQIEQSLKNSSEVGQDYYSRLSEEVLAFGNSLSRYLGSEGYLLPARKDTVEKVLEEKRREYGLAAITLFTDARTPVLEVRDPGLDLSGFKPLGEEVFRKALVLGEDAGEIQSAEYGDLVSGVLPLFSRTSSKAIIGAIVMSKFVPGVLVNRLKAISAGIQEYRQLKMLKKPIKISHIITLSIVTLLIIFASVWFGFYLSKEITVPIRELAEGTHRIASGDYDFFIDLEAEDEIGALVNSFNRMTIDLKTGKEKLEEANRELLKGNEELEQRRLYMEIVLANVAAGVVSADSRGKILTINKSACRMLGVNPEAIVGKSYKEVLAAQYIQIIEEFLRDRALFAKGFLKRAMRITLEKQSLALLVSMNVLRDDRGNYLGLVAVFEDLSEIEKVERMAAWREVAKRIAHEVKNPLTPIQLSAQRLKKRYGEMLQDEDRRIFNACTDMIISEVEELKCLVNEFSQFARLPAASMAPCSLSEIVEEALALYREAHKDVRFTLTHRAEIPTMDLDRTQIKRALINLLDNAIEAMDEKGEVEILLDHDPALRLVTIVVSDNGRGLSAGSEERLFEPYFSTKKQGTGLGLAIVNRVMTDHNGSIRVERNHPKGTRFLIELPVAPSMEGQIGRAA